MKLTLDHPGSTDTVVTCNSYYTWIDGNTYLTSNNTVVDTLTNSLGCDSIVALNLTISGQYAIDTVVECASYYTWINGITYTQSIIGVSDTLNNASGCDSVVYLNLNILYPENNAGDTVFACDSFLWESGEVFYSDVFNETDTILNSQGCDSVIYLNLVVSLSYSNTDSIVSCGEYTWINGVTYYSDNNSDQYVQQTLNGCDSLISLDLTVNHVDTSVSVNGFLLTSNASNANFQWIDCNSNTLIMNDTNNSFEVTQSGSYAVEIEQYDCIDTSNCFVFTNVLSLIHI